jgi:hypothetical protein
MPPNKNDYFTTKTEDGAFGLSFNSGVVNFINSQLEFFRTARVEREETWLECWAMYLNSSQARNWIRSQAIQTIGEINNDWRHNLNTGKAYEQVETVVAYLQQAFSLTVIGLMLFRLNRDIKI